MTHATKEELDTLGALIVKAKIGLLTTINLEGALVSRPMSAVERDFDGDLWFFTEDPSDKTDELRANPEVNVAMESGKGWVSIAGTAHITRDPKIIDELWTASAEAWFEQGRDDPKVALIRVDAHTAEFWTMNEPKAVTLFKYAKAAATGGRPNVGTSTTVEL
jgi:general stress protein 26